MDYAGIVIGFFAFIIIGVFHPLVIWGEYYFSYRIWPLFLVVGMALCAASIYADQVIPQSILGIAGFSSFWSILELRHQKARVEKGWFPRRERKERPEA